MCMETKTIKVEEEVKRGTRGGPYIYVVDRNKLIHIGEYAIKTLPGKYKDRVIYKVPLDKVAQHVLYCFDFSRSGGEFLYKCKIQDFEDGYPKTYEYFELLEKRIHEIRDLRFQIKDPTLVSLLTQFNQLFTPMIYEIKEYGRKQNFEYSFMGHQARLANAFRDPKLYYFTSMSLPSDRSRINSLKVTRRWIYQLWVLKLLCEALQVSKFAKHEYQEKPHWCIEQGSDLSTCKGETPYGSMTFWLEFQPSKGAHMTGMFVEKRVPIRPDIITVKSHFERTKDFIDSGAIIDMLIECKEDQFDKWKSELKSQILPYRENFKPRHLIIASLEHVPDGTKRYLESQQIKVIDGLKPNSKSTGMLFETVRREFRG